MCNKRKFFDKPIKNNLRAYKNIRKFATGQDDNCTPGCLLNYPYFKKCYKLIAKDLSRKRKLDSDPKAIQQISFTLILH